MTSVMKLVVDTDVRGDDLGKLGKDIDRLDAGARKAGGGIGVLDIAMGDLVASGIQSLISGAGQAAGALIELGGEAAEIASDAKETESLLTNALGPAYEDFAADVDAVSEATGRSSRAFKEQVAPILAMTKAQGFANEVAAETSVAFGQAALDLNSYFNSTTGFEDLQSALAGSSETLQKYGIDVKEGALQQAALSMGLIESLGPLDTATRTTVLLAEVQRQAADAMGDATRTAGEYANTQRNLAELTGDYKSALGDVVLEGLEPFTKELLLVGKTALPVLEVALEEIIDATGKVSIGLIQTTKNLSVIRAGFKESTKDVREFSQGFTDSFNAVSSFTNITGSDSLTERIFGVTGIPAITDGFSEALGYLRDVGEETLATEAAASNLANSFGAATVEAEALQKGLGGASDSVGSVEPIENYATAVTKAAKAYQLGAEIFSEGDFAALDDAFGGSTTSNINATADSLGRVAQNVSVLNQGVAKFTGGSFFDEFKGENDEAGLFAEVAERLPDNVSVGLTIDLLRESGESEDSLESVAQELIENQLGDRLVEQFDAGLLSEQELINKTKELFDELENLESPLLVVEQGAGAIYDALNDLNSDFQSKLTLQIDGLEQLKEASAIISELSGVQIGSGDLPASSTISTSDTSFRSNAERSTVGSRGRRQ